MRKFGAIPDIEVGSEFESRRELNAAGVHRPLIAGISGSILEGADSIVLNGGYEDDEDYGDVVIYTGHGGNDPDSGRQILDQALKAGNLALAKSHIDGIPVRVIRGSGEKSPLAPRFGYRYDGLYSVDRFWSETGKSGHVIWRFRLVRDDPDPAPWAPDGAVSTSRRLAIGERLVRDTGAARRVKELHDYTCQVCGVRLNTPAGPYAEGAHIRPLGRPHDGPDDITNLLCLCPNHHVLFDNGALCIARNFSIITADDSITATLRLVPGHNPAPAYFAYHRRLFPGLRKDGRE
jgi:putative restriction endonuclease